MYRAASHQRTFRCLPRATVEIEPRRCRRTHSGAMGLCRRDSLRKASSAYVILQEQLGAKFEQLSRWGAARTWRTTHAAPDAIA